MTKKTILTTLTHHQTAFHENLELLSKQVQHSSIRKIRVSIKTRKSFSQFIDFATNSSLSTPALPKDIKKLYKAGGTIRGWHISKKKVRQLLAGTDPKIIVQFEVYCKHHIESLSPGFCKQVQSTLLQGTHKTLFNDILQYFTDTSLDSLKKTYKLYKASIVKKIIEHLNKKKISDDMLHDIRKEIKHLLYFAVLFEDTGLEDFTQFSKKLGRWNDQIELSCTLKTFGKSDKKIKKWSKKMREHIKEIIKQEKKVIIKDLRKYFTIIGQ